MAVSVPQTPHQVLKNRVKRVLLLQSCCFSRHSHFRTFKFSIFLKRSYEFKRFSSGVYWQRGDRECYMVRARRVDTADFMQGKYLSCSHQVLVCACQTLTAFINHIWACTWLLGAHRDTYRGHVSWLVATQAGVSEPLLSIMAAGW